MKRRPVVGLLAALGCGAFGSAFAQPQRTARLGVLATFPPSVAVVAPLWSAFYAEIAARGWNDGRNLMVTARYNEGRPERDGGLTAELLATPPEVMLATNSGAIEALRKATRSIPIVMVNVSHAVETGFVASMARPAGNVTGVTNQAGDMQSKFVELLRAVRPDLKRLGVLWSPGNVGSALAFRDCEIAATRHGLRVLSLAIERGGDIEPALATAALERVEALHVHPAPPIGPSWRRIVTWATDNKVATLGQAGWVREGFLMSYWAHIPDLYRIAAGFVDRILRGADPAELPVEQPTRFELTINLKTARTIGVTIPQSLLLRADQVIE